MPDEIIRDVWRSKDKLAKRFKYDLAASAAEMRKRQKKSGRKTFNLAGKVLRRTRAGLKP